MPVRRRHERHELTAAAREILLYGRDLYDSDEFDRAALAELWEEHGAELVAEAIATRECVRPFGWWAFDHGQERPLAAGMTRARQEFADHERAATFGYLHTSCISEAGEFLQEPEPHYLDRLGLLTLGERQALPRVLANLEQRARDIAERANGNRRRW